MILSNSIMFWRWQGGGIIRASSARTITTRCKRVFRGQSIKWCSIYFKLTNKNEFFCSFKWTVEKFHLHKMLSIRVKWTSDLTNLFIYFYILIARKLQRWSFNSRMIWKQLLWQFFFWIYQGEKHLNLNLIFFFSSHEQSIKLIINFSL